LCVFLKKKKLNDRKVNNNREAKEKEKEVRKENKWNKKLTVNGKSRKRKKGKKMR